jgi:hypothetical protein
LLPNSARRLPCNHELFIGFHDQGRDPGVLGGNQRDFITVIYAGALVAVLIDLQAQKFQSLQNTLTQANAVFTNTPGYYDGVNATHCDRIGANIFPNPVGKDGNT